MNTLSLQNPIFVTYLIRATIMILKGKSMAWLTVVRMMQVRLRFRIARNLRRRPSNPNPDPKQLEPHPEVERIAGSHERSGERPVLPRAGFLFVLTEPSLSRARAPLRIRRDAVASLRRVLHEATHELRRKKQHSRPRARSSSMFMAGRTLYVAPGSMNSDVRRRALYGCDRCSSRESWLPYAHRASRSSIISASHTIRGIPVRAAARWPAVMVAERTRPLLVHGAALVIQRARVMLEYLAEAYGFDRATPLSLSRGRCSGHAMALMDIVVAPRLAVRRRGPRRARIAECLRHLRERAMATPLEPVPASRHVAPRVATLQLVAFRTGPSPAPIRSRPRLAAWLDGAARLAPVVRTSPSPQDSEDDFHAACAIMNAAKPSSPPG